MKKLLITTLALTLLNLNLFAQDIEQDITYYKFLNKLWTMSSAFDKVAFHLDNNSVEMEKTRKAEIEVIAKLYTDATLDYSALMDKPYKVNTLQNLEEMLQAMELSLADLKGEAWSSDINWQVNYNIVKMKLGELNSNDKSIMQYSKSDI